MEKHVELGCLLDYYGALLTERQRALLEQHVSEDCSLAEIAEREGISRQGVRDALKRGEEQLYELEHKLGLMKRDASLNALRMHCRTACVRKKRFALNWMNFTT